MDINEVKKILDEIVKKKIKKMKKNLKESSDEELIPGVTEDDEWWK